MQGNLKKPGNRHTRQEIEKPGNWEIEKPGNREIGELGNQKPPHFKILDHFSQYSSVLASMAHTR